MGAGLSFSQDQVIEIIKRDLKKTFKECQQIQDLNRYTKDGIEIYYDFSHEEMLKKKIKEIENFTFSKNNRK